MSIWDELGSVSGPPLKMRPRGWCRLSGQLLVVSVICLMIGGIGLLVHESKAGPWTIGFAVAGGLFVVAAVLVLLLRPGRLDRTVSLHERGLLVRQTGRAPQAFCFDDLTALSYEETPQLREGVLAGTTRTFRIWRSTDPVIEAGAELHGYARAGSQEDQAQGDLALRLRRVLAERLQSLLDADGTVRLPGLEMTRLWLTGGGATLTPDELTAADIYDGHVCLWRGGECLPFCRLPLSTPNALPLLDVLSRRLAQHSSADEAGLGRVLFEWRPRPFHVFLAVLIGLPLSPALLGLPILLYALHLYRLRFRACRNGVSLRRIFGERALRFDEVERYSYRLAHEHRNGIYTGTRIGMEFIPADPRAKAILHSFFVPVVNEDLSRLHDRVVQVVACRLRTTLRECGEVEWSPDAILLRDGVRYRILHGRRKGEWQTLPAERIAGTSFHQGGLFLFEKDKDTSVWSAPLHAPNLYPGLILLGEICQAVQPHDVGATPPIESGSVVRAE